MKLFLSLPKNLPRTALTIGSFDGVHLGHQALIKEMKKKAEHTTVLTFINHPLEILKPLGPLPKVLTPFPFKLSLFNALGVDCVIAITFTPKFAALSFDELLEKFSLSHLFLGKNSFFGKNREGSEENVKEYALTKNFVPTYFEKVCLDGAPISSSRIRAALGAGDFREAESLLGRPYAIFWPPAGERLALPPDDSYLVSSGERRFSLKIRGERAEALSPTPSGPLLIHFEKKLSAQHV